MTRRISSSRPMTGSSLPARASARQVAAVALERLVGGLRVLGGDALAAAHLLQRGEDALSCRRRPLARMRCASPPASAAARSRCSVETYSSSRRLASSSARSMSWRARGSSDSWPPAIRARRDSTDASSSADARDGSAPSCAEGHGRDALGVLEQRREQVLGVEHGALRVGGEALGDEDRLLRLLGVSIELHGSASRVPAGPGPVRDGQVVAPAAGPWRGVHPRLPRVGWVDVVDEAPWRARDPARRGGSAGPRAP